MAKYVTQGTIQLVQEGATTTVRITPTKEYLASRDKKEYTVFLAASAPADGKLGDAKVGKIPFKLALVDGGGMLQLLIAAASKQIAVEIEIDDDSQITSVTMPATHKSPSTSSLIGRAMAQSDQPENVIFWGAGATAALGFRTTPSQAKFLSQITGSLGNERQPVSERIAEALGDTVTERWRYPHSPS